MHRFISHSSILAAACALTVACGTESLSPEAVEAQQWMPDGHTVGAVDADGDGVLSDVDCDDDDSRLGQILYESELTSDDGDFEPTAQLGADWKWEDGGTYATSGGQEAQLSDVLSRQANRDYVVFADLAARGTQPGCGYDCMDVCGAYEPDDCYTDYQALALGILEFKITGGGKATLKNLDHTYDICLEGHAMWDHPGSQSLVVGPEVLAGSTYRIKAGKTLDLYYGSWTTANGKYEPHKGKPAFWCYQNGTSLSTGTEYASVGALLPEDMQAFLSTGVDTDGDGVDDLVDWKSSNGVQAQHNVWDYQDDHAAMAIGKRAESTTNGTVEVTLTLQNRGKKKGTATITDTIPYAWNVVSCSHTPDSETAGSEGTELTWEKVSLDGCTKDCSDFKSKVITCEIASNLSADQDIVELPAATAAYNDGDDDEVSTSMLAVAFDYDHDADGDVMCGETERWRSGILARASLDSDQDEGFNGYRCALAHNAEGECFDPGHFLQIAAFLDAEEDDINSECEGSCDNSTFDELARIDHDGTTDLADEDAASLEFWLFDSQLYCAAKDEDGTVFASAVVEDETFRSGESGFSTLNMFGQFDYIKICKANEPAISGNIDE
ncbi:MAG: hypothetical protein AB8H79_23590 [Myxococcota bacterium]